MEEEIQYNEKSTISLVDEPVNKFTYIDKRDLNVEDIKYYKNVKTWYDDAAEQFGSIYNKVSNCTNNFITSFFQTLKEKVSKLKGNIKNWKSFYDDIKKSVVETKDNFSKSISFFREAKDFPNRLKKEEEEKENKEQIEVIKGRQEEQDQNAKVKIVEDNDNANSFFSFFRNAKVKKRNKRRFEIDDELNKILIDKELNFTELKSNEIIEEETKSYSLSPIHSLFEEFLLNIFENYSFSYFLKSSSSNNSIKNKRSYNYPINRYLRKKEFNFGTSELVKGTKEWDNYYSYVEK